MTSRLIRSGQIRPPIRANKSQSGVLQAIDHSVARSMTAQPPGIRPSALWVTTHGQQVASLVGGKSYPSAEVQSVYSTAPANREATSVGFLVWTELSSQNNWFCETNLQNITPEQGAKIKKKKPTKKANHHLDLVYASSAT